jgi:hypothetical protein
MGRFIALHMSTVSSVPDAPTSVPAMMSTGLCSENPVAAVARPVKELRSDTTTGMSPPPIGITARTPSRSAAARKTKRAGIPATFARSIPPRTTSPVAMRKLIGFWSG